MKYNYLFLAAALTLTSCGDSFLDSTPKGKLSDDILGSKDGIEALCISAYAALAGPGGSDGTHLHPTNNWVYGDVRAETAYKGGGGIGDIWEFNAFETFTGVYANNGLLDGKWFQLYCSLQRTNSAIRQLNKITTEQYADRDSRLGEMRMLRAHFYFELSRLFNKIPYFDENVANADYIKVPNDAYTRDQLLEKITDELSEAAKLLPEHQSDKGRVNRYAALAYEAKVTLYRAYEQDEKTHQVIAKDPTLLTRVVTLCEEVAKGGYGLLPDFQQLSEVQYEHGVESVFGIEYSIEDGTADGRINWSSLLNVPKGPAYGGDGFFQPSQNLVNSYKTDEKGLPDLTHYNDDNLLTVADGFKTGVDPRLDFTVGRLGVRWKGYEKSPYDESWAREPATYGYYGCKKFLLNPGDPNMLKGWPWGGSSLNFQLIRYADVLLWKAEALIELNREDEAVELINAVRNRAKASKNVLAWDNKDANDYAANYHIGAYRPGVNCDWTQTFAREALYFERKLEFAMEGERFFDLVRWGIAAKVLNDDYFAKEKGVRDYLKTAKFVAGRDEYFPIPQAQINFSGGLYQQNPKYN